MRGLPPPATAVPSISTRVPGAGASAGSMSSAEASACTPTGKKLVGGLGVGGDTSCADHEIAWRTRKNLGLDHLAGVGGVSGDKDRPDNIVFDIKDNPAGGTGVSAGGFGHPKCINTADPKMLPTVQP